MGLGIKCVRCIVTRMTSDRGQSVAIGVLRMFVGLVFAALLAQLLRRPFDDVTELSRNATTNQTAQTGVDWSVAAFTNLPFFVLLLGAFGIIVLVVFRQGRV